MYLFAHFLAIFPVFLSRKIEEDEGETTEERLKDRDLNVKSVLLARHQQETERESEKTFVLSSGWIKKLKLYLRRERYFVEEIPIAFEIENPEVESRCSQFEEEKKVSRDRRFSSLLQPLVSTPCQTNNPKSEQ